MCEVCECEVKRTNKARHEKTKKHRDNATQAQGKDDVND